MVLRDVKIPARHQYNDSSDAAQGRHYQQCTSVKSRKKNPKMSSNNWRSSFRKAIMNGNIYGTARWQNKNENP